MAFRSGSSCPAGIPPIGSRCSTTSRCSTSPIRISGWRRPTLFRIRRTQTLGPGKPDSNRCRSAGWFRARLSPISRPVTRCTLGASTLARGIAFGGDTGVSRVDFSSDGGKTWQQAELGKDEGKYSFRQWQTRFVAAEQGIAGADGPLHEHERRDAARHALIGTRAGSCSTSSSRRLSSRPEEEKMLRRRLPLLFIAVAALVGACRAGRDRLLLKSVSVDLPVGDRMFRRAGLGCRQQQLPRLPLRRHGALSTGAVEGTVARRG